MKLFKFLSMMIAAMACTFAFTSCGDDEDEPSGDYQCVIKYEVEFSEDWLNLSDVKITYTDINGATQTETLTKTTWSKEMSKTGKDIIPASIKVVSTVKPDAKVDENGKYNLVHTVKGMTCAYYSNGGLHKAIDFGLPAHMGLTGAKVIDYINRFSVIEYSSDKAANK